MIFSFKYTRSCLILFKGCILFHCTVVPCLCNKFFTKGFLKFLIFCYYKKKKYCANARVVVCQTHNNSNWVLRVRGEIFTFLRCDSWDEIKIKHYYLQFCDNIQTQLLNSTKPFLSHLFNKKVNWTNFFPDMEKMTSSLILYPCKRVLEFQTQQIWGQDLFLRMVFPAEDTISITY